MSAPPPPPGFHFHEKYGRYYRDFEREGNWYRQYDDENAKLTPIPALAIQTPSAQPGSVPRSVPAQPPATRDPYGGRTPSVPQTSTPPVTRDPWGARRPSAQLSYSAVPQIGPQSQATAAIDDVPSREPWGMSQSPPNLAGNYVLEREQPQERERSRRRADPKYRERGGVRREGGEGDPPETIISRTISRQQPTHERKGQRRPSESSRSRPAQGRTPSFSKPSKRSDIDISRRLEDVSLNQAIESDDEDEGPTLGSNAPPYFSSSGDSTNQSHYGSNLSAFNPGSIETSSPLDQPTYSDLSSASTLLDTNAGIGPQYESSMPSTTMPTFADVSKSQLQAGIGQHFHNTKDFAHQTYIQPNYGLSQNINSSGQISPRHSSGQGQDDGTQGDKRTSWELEGLGKRGYKIKGSKGKDEPLDKSFCKRDNPTTFFKVGRVFAMLWHENVGLDGTVLSQERPLPAKGGYSVGPHQEPIYTSVRRMIVVKASNGYSWCLPISTYNGRGTTKRGLNAESHAIVHMTGTAPQFAEGETGMTKEPLSIDPFQAQKLNGMSRVNFDKVYTVEHNVKVKNIGKVSDKSMPKLTGYWKIHKG